MKSKYIPIIFTTLSLVVISFSLSAQTIQLPYYCGFEDPEENARWSLNYNPNLAPGRLKNLWHIGTAVAAEGDSSLYVSSDGGLTASYINSENTILAYRVFDLPPGTYDVSFDWMAYADATSAIHVAWIDSTTKRVLSLTTPDIPEVITDNELQMSEGETLNGVSVWKHAVTKVTAEAGKKYKLVFVWNNNKESFISPGGCIDNVEIAKTTCTRPSDLITTSDRNSITASWKGSADEYQFGHKLYGTDQWTISPVPSGQSQYTVSGLGSGVYDLKVRGICAGDTGIWMPFDKVLIYEPLCIDYVNLKAAECKYGTVSEIQSGKGNSGVVDYGYENSSSRHTVHFLPGEKDPRTDRLLSTVPPGEIASVRIGTWDSAHAEQITYKFTVDTLVARVLLLKYAIVFDTPDHPKVEQPHFVLQIFDDATGVQILPACAAADFYATKGVDGWSSFRYGGRDIVWKDWTTLGINLGEFHGKTIRIRISVYGCVYNAHYAYAYFSLGCSKGTVEGMSCGKVPTEFRVPEGFDYKWYKVGDPNKEEVCDSNVYVPDKGDVSSYYVDLMYKENHDCKFTLTAHTVPRVPRSEATYTCNPHDCQNVVDFISNSGVYALPPDKPEHLIDETIDSYLWDFGTYGTSQTKTPQIVVPNAGDTFTVVLQTGYNNCYDTKEFRVEVPAISTSGHGYIVHDTLTVCIPDLSVQPQEKPDTTHNISEYGCDSMVIYHHKYVTSVDTTLEVEICSDTSYLFVDRRLTASGTYTDTLPSHLGCDSIITLHLTVNEVLTITPITEIAFCADDSVITIPLDILSGHVDSIEILFSQPELQKAAYSLADNIVHITVPDALRPDIYDAIIVARNDKCGSVGLNVRLSALYPSAIVRQKWNDVLAVLNSAHNGGYTFTSYRWYVDGTPIDGATGSYLYLDASRLDPNSVYRAELTRPDGVRLQTCDIIPTTHSDLTSYPTIPTPVSAGQSVYVNTPSPCTVHIYNMAGQLISMHTLSPSDTFPSPHHPGIYILTITVDDIRLSHKLVVR